MLPPEDRLARKRYVSLVLRLLVDERGRLLHGEVVDAEGAVPRSHFVRWAEIGAVVRLHLTKLRQRGAPDGR